jgi:type II secretory pathway pseudopilin PulG
MRLKIKQFGLTRQIRSYPTGFTLVEVLIVVAFILVLVSIVLMATSSGRLSGEEQLTRATIELLDTALQEYYDYTGTFPPQDVDDAGYALGHCEELYRELSRIPDCRKVLGKIPESLIRDEQGNDYLEIYDSWGLPLDYVYDSNVNTFPLLRSAGPNRSFRYDEDDVKNKE